MLYSVWNASSKVYDYYQTPTTSADVDVPVPKHVSSRFKSEIGHGNDVAWPLPPNAVRVGSGVFAKGSIAMPASEVSAIGGLDLGGVSYIGLIVGLGVAYFLLRD